MKGHLTQCAEALAKTLRLKSMCNSDVSAFSVLTSASADRVRYPNVHVRTRCGIDH